MHINNDPIPAAEDFNTDAPFSVGFIRATWRWMPSQQSHSQLSFWMLSGSGCDHRKGPLVGTVKSASIAALLFGLHLCDTLGWIGNRVDLGSTTVDDQNLGTFLLTFVAGDAYGQFGAILLGAIVLVACSYGCRAGCCCQWVLPQHHPPGFIQSICYHLYIDLLDLQTRTDQVIQTSVPVLSIIYPIAMTCVLLLFVTLFSSPRLSFQLPVYLVIITSVLAVVHRNGWSTWHGWKACHSLPARLSGFR